MQLRFASVECAQSKSIDLSAKIPTLFTSKQWRYGKPMYSLEFRCTRVEVLERTPSCLS